MQWDAQKAAFAFAGIGFLSALVQGGLIRRLVPRFGEAEADRGGLVLAACGFAGMALVKNAPELAFAMMLLGIGQGLLSPSVSGLLSRMTPMNRQGAVFGTLTSAQTLARMISYSAWNVLLGKSIAAPYWGLSASMCSPSPWRAIRPRAWSRIKVWPTPLMIFEPRNRSVSIKLRKGLSVGSSS